MISAGTLSIPSDRVSSNPQPREGALPHRPSTGGLSAWFTVIASQDSNHPEDPCDSREELAITGPSADIVAIEAAYHYGLVPGVPAMGLLAPVRPEHRNVECHAAFQAGLAAGIKERRQMIMRLFISGVSSPTCLD